MANIYTEQQVGNYAHDIDSTGLFEEARRVENYGKQFEQQAQNYEDKAKNTYALALKVQWQSSINDIAANPEFASNPVAMEKEIKNITDKMSAEIVDDDAKTDFLINSITKRNAYVQKAYAQRIKMQEEQYKSSVYNSIYSNIDSIGLSMADGILGVGDGSTLDASLLSDKEIREGINAKDEYGNYIFSDTERRSMIKDYEKNVFDNVKAGFELLTESQQKLFSEQLDKDSVSLGVVKDKDGNEVNIPLTAVVSNATYSDLKKYVRDENDKIRQRAVQEHNLLKKESEINFLKNPTQTNLDEFLAFHPNTSEAVIDRMMERIKATPNYDAKTTFESNADAYNGLREILALPTDTEEQKADMLDRSMKYAEKLTYSNTNGDLTYEDKEEYLDDLINAMANNSIKQRINDLPGLIALQKMHYLFYTWGDDRGLIDYPFAAISAKKKINDISHTLASGLLKMAVEGKSKDEILSFYNKNMEEAVKAKYWYIKDLQDKRLVKGETIINLGYGEPYIFNGFTDGDILITRTK